ncbi:MAG TPA: hypothetical protein VGK84_08675 [Candidatus Tumulicola sp.]|jgi:hypothetical protein
MLHAVLAGLLVGQTVSPVPSQSPVPSPGVLSASPASVDLNPAQQRSVQLSGANGAVAATAEQHVVTVGVDPATNALTITATQATGNDVVHVVDASGAALDVPVRVAFNAGTIVPQTTLQVTGNPAGDKWLAATIRHWVTLLTPPQTGARTTVGDPQPQPAPLQPGAQTSFSVPVTVGGDPNYFDVNGSTQVDVQSVAVQPFQPQLLFYDDDPEHVLGTGVLFSGSVATGRPARLYYYHDAGPAPQRVVILLSSDSQTASSVQIVDASAGPNIDVMQVGHTVSRTVLDVQPKQEGVIANVSSGLPLLLRDVSMTAREGIAGSVDFNVLSGGPVTVTVASIGSIDDPRGALSLAPLPRDGHNRSGTFALASYGADRLQYTAGGADAALTIGDREPSPQNVDASAEGRDYGDYGVLHSIAIALSNPLPSPSTAYLYFRPIIGIDRASFLVNGNLVELGCVRRSVPYQIASFALAPNEQTTASVLTMTDGGSFFPVEIGVSATPPLTQAPPVNAPDGCFPKPQ